MEFVGGYEIREIVFAFSACIYIYIEIGIKARYLEARAHLFRGRRGGRMKLSTIRSG